jgi:hypothetical protein
VSDDIKRLFEPPKALRELRITVTVQERTRAVEGHPWGNFQALRRVVVSEAAVEIKETVTSKGTAADVHIVGIPEAEAVTLKGN